MAGRWRRSSSPGGGRTVASGSRESSALSSPFSNGEHVDTNRLRYSRQCERPDPSLAVHGIPFASAGTLGVYRGQSTDFEAYAINDAHAPVVVTAARLIRVPGYSSAPLIHVGIRTGKVDMVVDRNWPPDGVTVRPLIGATLPHGRVYLAGGFASKRPGTYMAAGPQLTYRTRGHTFQTDAWGGGAACVAPGRPSSPPLCRYSTRLLNAMTDYIHQH